VDGNAPLVSYKWSFWVSNCVSDLGIDTAFKQQRLKAWQPILTPKTVLPTFFILGIIFAPIGAALIWGSGQVDIYNHDRFNPKLMATLGDRDHCRLYQLRGPESRREL
jgi:hypothetical protein